MFWKYNVYNSSWAILIMLLSLMPGDDIPDVNLPSIDKGVHFILYSVLCYLNILAFKKQSLFYKLREYALQVAFLVTFLYSFLLEVLQFYVAYNRSFDFVDLIANFVGVIAGVALFKLKYIMGKPK